MRNLILPVLLISAIFHCSNGYSKSMTAYKTTDKMVLKGILKTEQFKDANDQPEDAYVLYLKNPINVVKDESGGPEKKVKEIQLAILYKQYDKADSCLNKEVNVTGYLYYPFDAHHHTRVLMRVLNFSCLKLNK